MPIANHSSSPGRLRKWSSSVFALTLGRQLSSDQLIRYANIILSQLQDEVEKVPKNILLAAQGYMRGGDIHPIKCPRRKSASWQVPASLSPSIILAVGSIHMSLMSATEGLFSRPAE